MIEIPYALDPRRLKEDTIQVCCLSSGKTGKSANDFSIEYDRFDVGTKAEIDKASENADKIKISDLAEPAK